MTEFEKECQEYSIGELELIVETQQDLYSEEEMTCLTKTLEKKKQMAELELIKNLPKEIKCPKCDMIISIESEKCPYCEYVFNKNKLQYAVTDDEDSDLETTEESDDRNSNVAAYIFSFIVPLVGFILGANLMSKDNEEERSEGKTCIILGIISIIISSIILFLTLG